MYIDNLNNIEHPFFFYAVSSIPFLVLVVAIFSLIKILKSLIKPKYSENNLKNSEITDSTSNLQAIQNLIKKPKFWYNLFTLIIAGYILIFMLRILG